MIHNICKLSLPIVIMALYLSAVTGITPDPFEKEKLFLVGGFLATWVLFEIDRIREAKKEKERKGV